MTGPRSSKDPISRQHLALVYRLAKRLRRRLPPAVDLGDLISDGFIGLERAANTFDSTRQVPFEAFAVVYVEGAMLDGLRRRQRQACALTSTDRVHAEMFWDPQIEQSHTRRQSMHVALRALPRRERLLVLLYYFEGLTMQQVGGCLGISEARVSHVHGRAIQNLKSLV